MINIDIKPFTEEKLAKHCITHVHLILNARKTLTMFIYRPISIGNTVYSSSQSLHSFILITEEIDRERERNRE